MGLDLFGGCVVVFNERPLCIFITKEKGPVEKGKLKMEELGTEDGSTLILRSGHGLPACKQGAGSQGDRLQLPTSGFLASRKQGQGPRREEGYWGSNRGN